MKDIPIKEPFRHLLEKHQLKKTNARLQVLEIIAHKKSAVSQPELEQELKDAVDRVTLYRILKTFEEKGILHKVLDQHGTANYALCAGCDEGHHHDQHLHFNCTQCNQVYCMDDIQFPAIKLPKGFSISAVMYTVLGTCNKCK